MPRMRIAAARRRGVRAFNKQNAFIETGSSVPIVNIFCPRNETHEYRAFNQAERELEALRNNH